MKALINFIGGGYSGCVWEPNFIYIDSGNRENDIDISVTGRIGERNFKIIKEYIKENGFKDIEIELEKSDAEYTCDKIEVNLYNVIDNTLDLTKILETFSASHLEMIAYRMINDSCTVRIVFLCPECKQIKEIAECEPVYSFGLEGCGGCAAYNFDAICSECYSLNSCECCASLFDMHPSLESDKLINELEHLTGLCQYCIEKFDADDLKELIHNNHTSLQALQYLADSVYELHNDKLDCIEKMTILEYIKNLNFYIPDEDESEKVLHTFLIALDIVDFNDEYCFLSAYGNRLIQELELEKLNCEQIKLNKLLTSN